MSMFRVVSLALLVRAANGLKTPSSQQAQHVQYEQFVSKLMDDLRKPAGEYKAVSSRTKRPFLKDAGLTMQTRKQLLGLKRLIESIVDQGLSGDVYETGEWRGGTGIFMVSVFQAYEKLKGRAEPMRRFFFFDSFQGFPEATTSDASLSNYLTDPVYAAPLDLVEKAFRRYGVLLPGQVHFVQGFFEDTVPRLAETRPIALLRMDGDLYSSTKVVLDHLYPKVQAGGWVVVDDYDWRPKVTRSTTKLCREAVDEYRSAHGVAAALSRDYVLPSWRKGAPAPAGEKAPALTAGRRAAEI